ncbi:MAG TPA: periplasmic heavy metal sensor [Noviherbaspirillum sp.]|uniref:Spy/CpxP family protein refolding chaperone n=1 Tax=Noviherbaspirillum sp. TaxID=1926288 RepID=UPI002B494FA1|nr:periplasmic heavy metal sensor [Noviherbaspirillum sp.]HJV84806.1 periplasmic heavy metal sensor [Noviherbaspirillum sp.]
MNRTALKWLLVISLALNAGMVASVIVNRMGTAPGPAAQHENASLPDYLQLNADQRRRWSEIEEGFLKDIAVNWREIRAHREALVRQVFSDKPDRSAIDAEQARIATLQDSQQRRVIAQLLAEHDLLDAQQRDKLMKLLLSRYTQEATEEEMLHRH